MAFFWSFLETEKLNKKKKKEKKSKQRTQRKGREFDTNDAGAAEMQLGRLQPRAITSCDQSGLALGPEG